MSDRLRIPVGSWLIYKVWIDADVLARWNALGLTRDWFRTDGGPAYYDRDGKARHVAETVTGKPCRLRAGTSSICLSDLEPLDGSPATTAGLDDMPPEGTVHHPKPFNPTN